MIEHTFTDSVGHKKGPAWADSVDDYGQADGASATILAGVYPKAVRLVDNRGVQHQGQFLVQTSAEVRLDDVLTIAGVEMVVRTAGPIKDLPGNVLFYQVMC
jgi:hypothetical protein